MYTILHTDSNRKMNAFWLMFRNALKILFEEKYKSFAWHWNIHLINGFDVKIRRISANCLEGGILCLCVWIFLPLKAIGQLPEQNIDRRLDSLYIQEVQDKFEPDKVLHAEPLYIDLIRDLGARKGEKEWNVGVGIKDNLSYDTYEALVEYEWAVIDRLGLEIELPFLFYAPQQGTGTKDIPSSSLESLKLAAQWSFFVSERHRTSMALGYIHEFELNSFRDFGRPLLHGHIFNPFFVVAKRWGQNWHSLIYTGPEISRSNHSGTINSIYALHTNVHYMISGTRNFIGVEMNAYFANQDFDMTIRPQMRLGISERMMMGIVGGIPVSREDERFSLFLRLIYEPGH